MSNKLNSEQPKLTAMQSFFLNEINKSHVELSPNYLASIYYESIGERRHAASRDSFGQTSAAYRTCRKLVSMNLIKENHYRTNGGYSYTMYIRLDGDVNKMRRVDV